MAFCAWLLLLSMVYVAQTPISTPAMMPNTNRISAIE